MEPADTRWTLHPAWQACPLGCLPEQGHLPDLTLPPELDSL
jgi:hypothetical protein